MDWRRFWFIKQQRIVLTLLSVIVAVMFFWVLRETYFLSMPLAYAFFIAGLLAPVRWWIARMLPKRWRAAALPAVMLIFLMIIIAIALAVYFSLETAWQGIPEYIARLKDVWLQIQSWAHANNIPITEDPLKVSEEGGDNLLNSWIGAGMMSIWSLLGYVVLIFFFVMFMLAEAGRWEDKSWEAFSTEQAKAIFSTVRLVAEKVRMYLLVRVFISLIAAITEAFWLWLVGVPFPFLWAMLIFLLNFVPNIGSILAIIPPTIILLIDKGMWWAFLGLGGFTILDQIIGYYIEPRMQGKNLSMSPLVLLVSVFWWTFIWGFAGALLAVPMTVTLIIACAHVPSLRFIATLCSYSVEDTPVTPAPVAQTA